MELFTGKIKSPFKDNETIEFVKLSKSKNVIEIEFSSSERGNSSIETIIGTFNGIGYVTLINCRFSGMVSGAGAEIRKYKAEYLLVGKHINNLSELFFDRVNFEITNLLHWTRLYSVQNNLYTEKKLVLKDFEKIKIYSSQKFSIDIHNSRKIENHQDYNKVTLKENVGLTITSHNKQISIWDFLETIRSLQKLIFILNAENSLIENITFYDDQNSSTILHCTDNLSISESVIVLPPIKFDRIKLDIVKIVETWLTNPDISTSVELILEKSINHKLSRENHFLNNCFALEIFHRRFKNYRLFEKEKFKEIKSNILNSIFENDIKRLIENNLAHLNEPSFRQRLTDFQYDFSQLLPDDYDTKKYISKIVKTRNYFVHRSSAKEIFNDFDLLYSAIYLESIVRINIFRILNIREEIVNDILNISKMRINGIYNYNKRL